MYKHRTTFKESNQWHRKIILGNKNNKRLIESFIDNGLNNWLIDRSMID